MSEIEPVQLGGIPGKSVIISYRRPDNCDVSATVWDVKLEEGVHHPAEYVLGNPDITYLCLCVSTNICFPKPTMNLTVIDKFAVPVVPESSYPLFEKTLIDILMCSAPNCVNRRKREEIRWDGNVGQITFVKRPKSDEVLPSGTHG